MKILALTVCCVDYYPQLGKSFLGGNTLNFAYQTSLLAPNEQVSVIGAIGADEYGIRIQKFLDRNGINTQFLYKIEGETASNQIVNDEMGERFGLPDAWKNGVYGSFLLSETDWSFALGNDIIAMPANNPNFETLLKKKTKKNLIVSDFLDVLNNVPIEKYISQTDIAFITGNEDLLSFYKKLAAKTNKLLVVSLNSKGSVAFYRNQEYRQEALPVKKVTDTTGCGDSYLAAFSHVYFKTNNIKTAMEAGALAAYNTLQH
jgi:fructoselysine 6-kinase